MERTIKIIQSKIKKNPTDISLYEDYFECIKIVFNQDKKKCFELNKEFRTYLIKAFDYLDNGADMASIDTLHKESYHLEAQDIFDSFLIYVEWKRDPSKKFYMPRRKVLLPLVNDLQDLSEHKITFLGISLPPRVGKKLSDDTPILTRSGWKNHGDLEVGDEVISPTGEFVKVTHVFPKANDVSVRCHFTDGTYIDAHENHEWVVYNRHNQKYETLETKQMINDFESGIPGKRGHRYNYLIPNRGFLKGKYKKLAVEPYTLGYWLGNGRNGNPDICCDRKDISVVERIIEDGYPVSWNTENKKTGAMTFGFKSLRKGLQKYDMCHSRRNTPKYIPEKYLTASMNQRLDLLAGLLDSDGSLISNEHRYQFSTTSEELKDGIITLISTFGWRTSVSEQEPKLSSSGIQGRKKVYIISFNPDFYIPCVLKRKQLKEYSKKRRIAFCGFENIEPKKCGNCISVEGGVYCAGRTLIPTHNSTLCIFFMTWMMGKNPEVANVMSGHSDKLTDGFYGEILNIITDTDTYLWNEVFPLAHLVEKSAKDESIDLVRRKRFPTLTCRSIEGTLTGAVEIGEGGVLYCDDLIADLEESINPDRLDSKYDAYLNQLKDRKKDGAIELMVGTRWNVLDPLGRIQEQYEDNPKYKFDVIPALDEDGESNFKYDYGVGFSTEYYDDIKDSIDDATWWAKYMGQPYVREGLIFKENDLNYYNGTLPGIEPDRIVAVCDVAWGGGDFLSMPIAYVFGNSVYVVDVVHNDKDKSITQPIVAGRIKEYHPHQVRFEANNGGSEYAEKVDEMLRSDNFHTNITSRKSPPNKSKLSRIIQYSPDILKFYFIDKKNRTKEYDEFMRQVTTFTVSGKNKHDDAPDSLSMLAELVCSDYGRVEVFRRPI